MTTIWQPPGAGEWKRDDAHITSVMAGFLDDLFPAAQQEGFADGFAHYGALLAGFDMQWVAGRPYLRPRIVGAPPQPIWGDKPPAKIKRPGKPPPKLIFKLLFALHPELRKRARRSVEVWEQRTWRETTRRWFDELRPQYVARTLEHTRVAIDQLDDRELADHVDAVTGALREMFVQHFRHAPMTAIVVGDYLVRAMEWTGATAAEVLATLQGASPASRAGADETAKVAAAIASEPALRALVESDQAAQQIVDAIVASPTAAGRALAAYLEVYGWRPLTGMDFLDKAMIEMPELLLRGIRAALAQPEAPRDAAAARLAELRARTPEAHRTDLDDAYAEARLAYGVRDDDVGVTLWRLGVMKRAVCEAARRLAARGRVHALAHAFEAKRDELVAMLRGGAGASSDAGPSADDLRARALRRAELDALEPPFELGEAGPMPAPECFPPAVARTYRAVNAFLHAMESAPRAAADDGAGASENLRAVDGAGAATSVRGTGDATTVRGTGASAGVYEGRARLVRDMADFARIEAGDVLIAKFTSPAYNVLLPLIGAIVTERGGLLSHAAIVAREYGIPAVVDTRTAVSRIADGARVRVDGTRGVVEVIEASATTAHSASHATATAATASHTTAPITLSALPAFTPATAGTIVPLRDATAVEVIGASATTADSASHATATAATASHTTAAITPSALPAFTPATAGTIVPLRDATAVEFGGKARALAAAFAAKLPVPDGLALDADLVERVARGDADARERVRAACAKLRGPWAVRSSAIGEDSASASFAGQHATVLGVQPGDLIAAIVEVLGSAHTAAALGYRKRMGITGVPRMGVVVQTLLRPDISGVLFSRDPTAAREGRLIEATWGLGEALVSGLVTPDRYRVGTDGTLLERAIGDKDIAIEARDSGGTAEVAIAGDRAREACLDDARLAELAQLASRCEQLFGGPQDLEWAVANGRLHLLQSRPVTA